MAIIYTYPTKATPADADLILISDSESDDPVNQTKQVTVASIKGLTSGVTSIIAGNNVNITSTGASGTGDVTVNAAGGGTFSVKDSGGTAITGIDTLDFNTNLSLTHTQGSSTVTIDASGGGGVDTFTNAFGTYITGTANSTATGAVDVGTLNLSASDGSSATTTTRFLSKDNEWAIPTYTTDTTYNVMGSGNSYAAGLVLAGNATHNDEFLRKDGTWQATASYEEGSWTPTMFGAGSPTVTATGQYVKIGRNVTVWFSLICSAGDTLAIARISGLPFNGQGASVYGHNGGASLSVNIGNSANVRYVTGTSGGATTLDLKVFTTSTITLNGPLPETENIDYQYSIGYWPNSQGNFTVRGTYTYKSQS